MSITTPKKNGFPDRVAITLAISFLLVGVMGCKLPSLCCDPDLVRNQLAAKTCNEVTTNQTPCREIIPFNVNLDDGLNEEEAVCIALANNSNFQAAMSQLGMAGGDVVQAALLANPQGLVYFPVSDKQGQFTLYAPIESYLLRPYRVNAANREYHRLGEQLVQNGLNLARDARNAYTDYCLAVEQEKLAEEGMRLRGEIASITEKRFADGEISQLETVAAKVDFLNAQGAHGIQQQNVVIAKARLCTWLGIPCIQQELQPEPLSASQPVSLGECELVELALASRPDYRSADWNVAASTERRKLARWLFLRLDGAVDVRTNSPGTFVGPGMRFDLPIFNRNEGGRIRADWEVNAAQHARDAIRDQIVQDVKVANAQLAQATANLTILQLHSLPALEEAIGIAKKGYADGGLDYLLVLQTTTQFLDARTRILDQSAASRRARAELERSVGHCLINLEAVDKTTTLREPSQNLHSDNQETIGRIPISSLSNPIAPNL